MAEAAWSDGQSVLPQERTALNVEMEWSDGKSGETGVPQYTETAFPVPVLLSRPPAWMWYLRT